MHIESVLEILVLIVGFYTAWNIGANDVSNAMGTSVGSGALTLKRAVLLAACFEFLGALIAGANVSETMQRGLIDVERFYQDPTILILGMLGALLGTGIWLQIASYCGWPVSTTHAIVGAIVGFATVAAGIDAVQWQEVLSIAVSWILSPLLSGCLSYWIFGFLQRHILFVMSPVDATRRLMPPCIGVVFGTFALCLIFNGLENLDLNISFPSALGIALAVGLLAMGIGHYVFRKAQIFPTSCSIHRPPMHAVVSLEKACKHLHRARVSTYHDTHDRLCTILKEVEALTESMREQENALPEKRSDYEIVERMFIWLQIFSACFVAFAHGANDVANAIGPVAAVLDVMQHGHLSPSSEVPVWLLALGGCGIIAGLATWGWRVIMTIGKRITELTPTRGFSAEFGAAVTILVASKLGLPISTTHCLVGAVLGVGFARGIRAINLDILQDIGLSWIVTLPVSALISILCFLILKVVFV